MHEYRLFLAFSAALFGLLPVWIMLTMQLIKNKRNDEQNQ